MKYVQCFFCVFSLGMIVSSSSISYAQEFAPRVQYVHYLGDFADTEPPVLDGILDDEAWTKTSQGSGPTGNFNHQNMIVKLFPELADDDPTQPGVLVGDFPFDDADLSYKVWTIFDDEYLYVAVAVEDFDWVNQLPAGDEDGSTWLDDSVEIFIDGNHNGIEGNVNDHPEEYETGGQFVLTSNGARRDAEAGDPAFGDDPAADWFASVLENDQFTGFNYEFRIKLSKIGSPQRGDVVGFTVGVNDADITEGQRDRQLLWTGSSHDESTYGDLVFGPRTITAPLIEESITIDGVLDEGAWPNAALDVMNIHTSTFNAGLFFTAVDDMSGNILMFHDASHLYIGVTVTDDLIRADTGEPGSFGASIWNDDALEIMIDGDLSQDTTNNIAWGVSAKYMLSTNLSISTVDTIFYGMDDADDWFAAVTVEDQSYTFEIRISKESFMPDPVNQNEVGLNLALNDDDNDDGGDGVADREAQMRWNGTPNREVTYGRLIFGSAQVNIKSWELY